MISSPAFANTIQLYREPHARRLFKARHHEVDRLQIRALALTESVATHRQCTRYVFQLRGGDEWLLARRYSEFAQFRDAMLRRVRQWEARAELKAHSREFELVSNALRRPIAPHFPRKHMRGDNDAIVDERRRGLAAFVRKLLDAYADIAVYLFHNPQVRHDASSGKYLQEIHDALEEFLQVPESQKELERLRTAAVLALEDVSIEKGSVVQGEEHPERTCCICLDDYDDSDAEVEQPFFQKLEEKQLEALARDKMVKLPCGHHFHEDCVIEWFDTSITCPLCRTHVVPNDTPQKVEIIL